MATRKAVKKFTATKRRGRDVRPKGRKQERNGIFDYFRLTESYASLLLGLVVVIIAAILLVSFLRNRNVSDLNTNQDISATKTVTQNGQQAAAGAAMPGSVYVVRAGDDLWKIAEEAYKDGYRWVDIARANNIADPGMINEGQRLSIPRAGSTIAQDITPSPTPIESGQTETQISPTDSQPLPSTTQVPAAEKITSATYTVVEGDYLWVIAERAYGSGYKWVEIAQANNLVNPNVIHPGNILKLPR